MTADDTRASVVTIGALSRRSGLSVKALRRYADIGLIYTAGRSPGNYRLFDESALWCVGVIRNLRALGLTVREIRELVAIYLGQPDRPIGRHLAERLRASRARLDARIAELRTLRRRIADFEARHAAELADRPGADFRAADPRFRRPAP